MKIIISKSNQKTIEELIFIRATKISQIPIPTYFLSAFYFTIFSKVESEKPKELNRFVERAAKISGDYLSANFISKK